MGFISGLLGGGGSAGGKAPEAAKLTTPTTAAQANTAYDQTQQGIAQQQNFVNALQAQNGIGNQSNVYNQLQGVVNGTGPNPAQAQLAQATQANTANQAALMAGQRGSASNPALIARQAAMQGAANQQNAAGQAATMQANQSLGALNAQGNLATQMVGQQAQGVQGLNASAQGQQGQLLNSIAGQNTSAVGNQASVNNANAQLLAGKNAGQANMFGSLLGAAGTVVGGIYGGPAGAALGGMAGSSIGGALAGGKGDAGSPAGDDTQVAFKGGEIQPVGPRSHFGKHLMAKGGPVHKAPVLLSPGEKTLTPDQAVSVIAKNKDPMSAGKTVPGKAKVSGAKDTLKNDTHATELEPGSIVIPRSVTQGEDAHKKAADFVKAILAKEGLKNK